MALTAREFDLLAFLAAAPRQVFSRADLLEQVWDSSPDYQDPSTVTVHIRRLRHKIEPDPDSRATSSTCGASATGSTHEALRRRGRRRRIGMVVLEIVMDPASGDRRELFALFAAMASLTLIAAHLVPTLGLQARSLRHTVSAVGLVAAGLIALAVAAGAWRMFLSVHDLHLLAVMLAVAAGLSIVFAVGITRSLRDDLAALRRTTDEVAAGDLAARTGVTRVDELGATVAALDEMIERLADAEEQPGATTTKPPRAARRPSATTCARR